MDRKKPVRHVVNAYLREGRYVQTHPRGHGMKKTKTSKLSGSYLNVIEHSKGIASGWVRKGLKYHNDVSGDKSYVLWIQIAPPDSYLSSVRGEPDKWTVQSWMEEFGSPNVFDTLGAYDTKTEAVNAAVDATHTMT